MKQVNRKENERETERGGACAESKDVGVCVCVFGEENFKGKVCR